MKIALIAPPYPLEEAPSPPLGLTCIAAVCEATGAEVIILDYIVRGYSRAKLEQELTAFAPDIIGTNSVTMNFNTAAGILKAAKEILPSAVTLMGGPHVSFDSEAALTRFPQIDIIVQGEGEATIAELLPVVHDRKQWKTIKGIVFLENGRRISTGRRPFIQDLDSLPRPARHLLPMARYLALGFPVSITTSRGCPNQCIFCLGRRMVGHKVRFRSKERIVDEIQELVKMGASFFNIADDLFTASRRRVRAVCQEILDRGLEVHWSAFSRVNTIDVETLKIMKRAGCHSVSFGVESGNADMLKRIKKGITADQAIRAAKACKEAGITGHVSFIVGLPGETQETLKDSQDLVEQMDISWAFHFLAPFPGTAVRENLHDYDLEILSDDWDLYNANAAIVRTSSLSPEEMEAFVKTGQKEVEAEWEAMKERYRSNTATPHEQLLVAGHDRTRIIFAMLTRDLLETHLVQEPDRASAVHAVCTMIASATNLDFEFIEANFQDLMEKRYIRYDDCGSAPQFFWAHHVALPDCSQQHQIPN